MTKIQKSFESLSIIKRHIEQGATLVDGQYQSSDESEIAKMNVTWLSGASSKPSGRWQTESAIKKACLLTSKPSGRWQTRAFSEKNAR